MPWWAITYLVILILLILLSIIKDIIDNRGIAYVSAEVVSGAAGASFIIASWYSTLAHMLSWSIIPLLIFSIAWDQYALQHIKKTDYKDLTEKENDDMHYYSKLFAIGFVFPCYLAGLYLIYQLIQN